MATLVTRNQFNVTPQGVVHKPTEAAFIPSPGDPLSGTMRLGQLVNQQPNGRHIAPKTFRGLCGNFGRVCCQQPRDVQYELSALLIVWWRV